MRDSEVQNLPFVPLISSGILRNLYKYTKTLDPFVIIKGIPHKKLFFLSAPFFEDILAKKREWQERKENEAMDKVSGTCNQVKRRNFRLN